MNELLRTALYETHKEANARLVPFAGWEMPVQYEGVIAEVKAVREGCGLFDVSHMGQFYFEGEGTTEALNAIVSAEWRALPVGRVAYALLLNESGGIIDDVMGYRLGENEWLVVVNASRAAVDEAHFKKYLPENVTLKYQPHDDALLAIQGRDAPRVLSALCDTDLEKFAWRDCRETTIAGAKGFLARGGYTGCDGFEFMFSADDAPRVWNALVENGAIPCGLGARDVLRLEAGLPLYGHELREEWTPAQSSVGFAAKTEKPHFIGRDALIEKGKAQSRIRGLLMEGKVVPREEYRVLSAEGNEIGVVTSGTRSVALERGIALAMIPAELQENDIVNIEIRGARHEAKIVKLPFVASGKK